MTRRLPSLKAREVMRALERAGFVQVRSKGSHRVFEHPGDKARRTIVSVTGQSATRAVMSGRVAVVWNQLRWRLGRPPQERFGFQHQSWT